VNVFVVTFQAQRSSFGVVPEELPPNPQTTFRSGSNATDGCWRASDTGNGSASDVQAPVAPSQAQTDRAPELMSTWVMKTITRPWTGS
jgi:hypothetical protein